MKVICFSTDERQDAALRNLAPSREFPTMSYLLRTIIEEFLKSREDQSTEPPAAQ